MDPEVKLVVPEVNGDLLAKEDRLIANPNCSTIQLMMVLAPLQQRYGIRRVVVSTYQSVTGTGMAAVQQMENERAGEEGPLAYPYPIDQNCLPHCDTFDDNGYTREELKLVNESRKILQLPQLALTATAVRVPVRGGHSESVNLELEKEFHTTDLRKLLADQAGLHLQDNPDMNQYPMPRYAEGRDEVFVGRIRRDLSQINSLNLWIVADNLRKGAATNALQIAERLYALKKS
jgi:aspartate-semialdehyde dehydrogenase